MAGGLLGIVGAHFGAGVLVRIMTSGRQAEVRDLQMVAVDDEQATRKSAPARAFAPPDRGGRAHPTCDRTRRTRTTIRHPPPRPASPSHDSDKWDTAAM
jgi:hypothetical protein